MKADKKKVLLLAVCRPEAIGGQAACARMLISNLKSVEWIALSFPLPGSQNSASRMLSSFIILIRSIWICLTKKISAVHILTACGRAALLEKLIMASILKTTGVKIILNFQGAFDVYYSGFSSGDQKLIKRLLRRCDVVLCLHDDLKDFLVKNKIVETDKIRVIPNAVPVDPVHVKEYSGNSQVELLYLGWIIANKGVGTLVRAVSLLVSESGIKNFRLTITGPEMEKGLIANLHAIALEYGAENFISFQPPAFGEKKKELFARSDLFIFPSRMEGFPFVLLEAMEAGLPVIATNVSPINLVVRDDQNGLLFEKDNASDLASKIRTLLNDVALRRKFSVNGRKHVLENYSLERVIPEYEKLYAEIL